MLIWVIAVLLLLFSGRISAVEAGPNVITISGPPAQLVINYAVAGQQPVDVSDSSTTYSVASRTSRTIVGSISPAMPPFVTLKIALQAAPNATSLGLVTMTTSNNTLVTDLFAPKTVAGLSITYHLSATVKASPVSNAPVVVTLTLI